MKISGSVIGWLLLAAVLSVPAFLFFNWWTSNKQNEVAAQTPEVRVSTATIFPGSGAAAEAVSRSSAAVPAPPVAPKKAEPAPAAQAPAQPEPPARAPVVAVSSAPAVSKKPAEAGNTAAQPVARRENNVLVSTQLAAASYFDPRAGRNPMMTPADYQALKDEEYRRREAERQKKMAVRKQRKEQSPQEKLKLQGIVGESVIINGEMYSVGDNVSGYKLRKIGANYIILDDRGKSYRMTLQ